MKVLALDTSTRWGGVALLARPQPADLPIVVAEWGLSVGDSHAARLIGWIEDLLRGADCALADLDGFVAVHGPGSFTGVRVALGTVRGLALACGRPASGVSSLDAMVEAYGPADRTRLALLDAGRQEVYSCRFAATGSPAVALEEPRLGAAAEAVRAASPCVVIPGPGSEIPARAAASGLEARVVEPPRSLAAAAGRLALLREAFSTPGADQLSPLYVRAPHAKLPTPRR